MKEIVTCAIIIFSAFSFIEQMTGGGNGMKRGGGGMGGGMNGYPSRRSNYRDF